MINFEVKTGLDIGDNISAHVPVGAIIMWSSATAPTGWVLCDGSTLNSTSSPQYSSLYSVISNTYGGTDNTNFKLPDLRGRTVVGVGTGTGNGTSGTGTITGGTSLTARSLSAWGGSEEVTLTSAQSGLIAHSHTSSLTTDTHTHTSTLGADGHGHTPTVNADGHNHTISSTQAPTISVDTHGHTVGADGHAHSWSFSDRSGGTGDSASGWDTSSESVDTTRSIGVNTDTHSHGLGADGHNHTVTVPTDTHTHGASISTDTHTHTLTNAADGHSHTPTINSNTASNATSPTPLIQPFISLNYIIKY
jgi:microcystin-dependent protein